MQGRDDEDPRPAAPRPSGDPSSRPESAAPGSGAERIEAARGAFDRGQGGRQALVGGDLGQASGGSEDGAQDTLVPKVELPRGGGALRGIGETFEANAFTGTGTLSIPVPLSPARGLTPELTLSYDSGRGNGPFGLGWGLSVPEISRRTDRGLPRYVDATDSDTFILAGAEDLVPRMDSGQRVVHDATTHLVYPYRPRVQGGFSRIDRWVSKSDGSTHWRVTSRDGVTSIFGETTAARVSDPASESRVYRWLLSRQYDAQGNEIWFEYKAEDLAGVDTSSLPEEQRLVQQATQPQRYLKRILYGNRPTSPPGPPQGEDDFCFEVMLDYGEHGEDTPTQQVDITTSEVRTWPARLDTFSSYRSRFDVRTRRLCRRVLLFHRFEAPSGAGAPPRLVRSLDVDYDEQANVTLLTGATARGYVYDALTTFYDVESLPPVACSYTPRTMEQTLQEVDDDDLEDVGEPLGGRVRLVDLDSEGIPGLLVQGRDALWYKPSAGDGRYRPSTPLPTRPSALGANSGELRLMNIDGSGRMSVVLKRSGTPAGFWRRDALAEDWQEFREFAEVPTVSFEDPRVHLVDLDGDGIADLLQDQGGRMLWWESRGADGWGRNQEAGVSPDDDAGPRLIYADPRRAVQFADMTGDGLLDIVRVENDTVCYWPNLGFGDFGRKITMTGAPHFDHPDQFDTRWLRVVDVDGTGPSDLVYFDGDGARVWFNEAGNGFSDPQVLSQVPPAHHAAQIQLADLLGKGTACVVWSSPLPAERGLRYIDLFAAGKPYLLTRVENNLGLETAVTYGSSTAHYLRDKAAGQPWATRLPFPVQVLDRVEVTDHARGQRFVSTYTYHHGYFDGPEREFRGFGRVEQRDTESFEHYGDDELLPTGYEVIDQTLSAPPVLTKTWFHTGAYLTRGSLTEQYASEYWQGDASAPPSITTALPEGLRGDERREALRALRGKPLRQEVYAEDGDAAQGNPYVVTETAYTLRRDQPTIPKNAAKLEDGRHHGVFFAHGRETRSFHYERDPDDPRFVQSLTLEVDEFGNVERSAKIAYPRRTPSGPAQTEQSTAKVVVSEVDFIDQVGTIDAIYRLGVPVETRSYELTGFSAPSLQTPWTVDDIDALVDSATEIAFEDTPNPLVVELRLLARTQTRYWNDALTAALPHGQVGARALVHETWAMAFTAAQIDDVLTGKLAGTDLTDALTDEGRYISHDSAWWARSELPTFDPDQFYLPVTVTDPFGNDTTIEYDTDLLFPVEVSDAIGNVVTVVTDYRVLSPSEVTDPNGNHSFAAYDGLGRVTAVAIGGKTGELDPDAQGDTLQNPTQWFTYDAFAWLDHQTPVSVHGHTREQYYPVDNNAPVQESVTYADGAGNILMVKVLAEPGLAPERDANGDLVFAGSPPELQYTDTSPDPRWVGTGRTILDNKGNPVKQYEPFFSDRSDYEDEAELLHLGVTPILHYDPLGRLVRTDYPDGTFDRVEVSPWQATSHDPSDTVLDSDWYAERIALAGGTTDEDAQIRAAQRTADYSAQTPTVTHTDVLGRPVVVVAHVRAPDQVPPVDDFLETRTVLDVSGNLLEVIDARGNTAQQSVPGMLGQVLHTISVDAGDRWSLSDVGGAPLRLFDDRGHTHRFEYDELRRPTHHWVLPNVGSEALVLLNVYGELATNPQDDNLRGTLLRQYDGAGMVHNVRFSFDGQLLQSERTLPLAYDQVPDWVDLDAETTLSGLDTAAASFLEAHPHTIEATFDALGRVVSQTTPDASVTSYAYNEGGLLQSVQADVRGVVATPPAVFVDAITYDVHGRRASVEHGNGTVTTYTYDPRSFRLTRVRTTRPGPPPEVVQDLRYFYDPLGNILQIQDDAQQTIYFDNAVVEPHQLYTYDALSRLVEATGREHISQGQPTSSELTPGSQPEINDPAALRTYTETYLYDEVGNILQVQHAATGGNWTRGYHYATDGNRLLSSSLPGDPLGLPATYSATYTHDAHGNMTAMPHLAAIDWDHVDRMQHADLGGGGDVYFQYDAAGNRLRKVQVNTAGTAANERVYLGSLELYRERDVDTPNLLGDIDVERETLHIADDSGHIVMVETLTIDGGSPVASPANVARYQYGNHLGTVALELDDAAAVISYEEFHPYGTSAYRAVDSTIEVSAKRYRYTGMERDEETGLDHMGARYYAPWLGRWTAADPIGLGDGVNRYAYVSGNPVGSRDPTGTESKGPVLRADATDDEVKNFQVLVGEVEGDHRMARDGGRHAVAEAVHERFESYAKVEGFSVEMVEKELRRLEPDDSLGFEIQVGGPNEEGVTEVRLPAPIVTRLAKTFGVPLADTGRLFPALSPLIDGAGTIDAPEWVQKGAETVAIAATVYDLVSLRSALLGVLEAYGKKKVAREAAEKAGREATQEGTDRGGREVAEGAAERAAAREVAESYPFRVEDVLQFPRGRNTISNATAKALGLEKRQAMQAMHKMKPAVGASPRDTGYIMRNGDYLDQNKNYLGNIYDYMVSVSGRSRGRGRRGRR